MGEEKGKTPRKQAFARAPGILASAASPPQPTPPGWSNQLPRSPAVHLPPARASASREGRARQRGRPGGLGTAPGSGARSLPPFLSPIVPFPRTPPLAVRGDAPPHRAENLHQNHSQHLLIPTPDPRTSTAKSVYSPVVPYPQMPPVGLFPGRMNVSAATHLKSAYKLSGGE